MMRCAYLGSGPISKFHVQSLSLLGVEVVTLHTRDGSKNAEDFAKTHGIHFSSTWTEFCHHSSIADFIVIAVKTEATPELLAKTLPLGLPILCEKPGAVSSHELHKLMSMRGSELVRFAYNRRGYATVARLKELREGVESVFALWPETKASDHQFIINGCHFVDLLLFVFGELSLISRSTFGIDRGFEAVLRTKDGKSISLLSPFMASANARIELFNQDRSHSVLSPLERLAHYSNFGVVEPTPDYNVRRYIPELEWQLLEDTTGAKPGFISMYSEFLRWVSSGNSESWLPGLGEAQATLSLTRELLGAPD